MQRRGGSGHQGRRTTKPKVRKAPTAPASTDHSAEQFDRLKRERDEVRQQQAATAEILRVIRASPTDVQPVFETIVRSAVSLCGSLYANAFRFDGELLHFIASRNMRPSDLSVIRKKYPMRPDSSQVSGRVVLTKSVIRLEDALTDSDYDQRYAQAMGLRRILGVPMLRDGHPIGVIVVGWAEAGPVPKLQEELLKTFADQAVIAIENVRLFEAEQARTRELLESLEQQTATSVVLKVISSSPGELEPVFQTMLENATRICDAKSGTLYRYDGDVVHLAAQVGTPPALIEFQRKRGPFRLETAGPGVLGRVIRTNAVVHSADSAADPNPGVATRLGGARSIVGVPMLKDNEVIGAIIIYRQEVRPFTDKQIELVTNFAAQAVIAIENTRLLSELRQSLEQQTATSEVLRVISSSASDLRPVFEAIAHNSVHLCGATYGVVFRFDGEMISFVAHHNLDQAGIDALHQMFPLRPNTRALVGRTILQRDVLHIADVAAEPNDTYAATHQALGLRTFLAVPMLRDGNPIGAIALYRREVALFSDRQIELVKAFADQAVIAIENARLLNDLNRLNQQLEQRVTDQVSEIERMSRLRRFLPPQVADLIVTSGTEKQLESHRREITALFCDLRGFTGFSESSDPEDVMALLREYHAAIGKIVNKYGGTLERYAGDGVMVVFNDPIPVDNPALQAVLMAIEMRAAIEGLIEKWRKLGHEIGFGIGIAHGFATLGTIGFEGRFDYAAIGTVSNVASRLCDEAKPGQILISPRVLMAVEKDITVEPIGDFALKGIRRPLTAYNVLDTKAAN
jgi:class 3 adenylate cyclase/putative methionine-R-sulfoxide reductase with GAF domain